MVPPERKTELRTLRFALLFEYASQEAPFISNPFQQVVVIFPTDFSAVGIHHYFHAGNVPHEGDAHRCQELNCLKLYGVHRQEEEPTIAFHRYPDSRVPEAAKDEIGPENPPGSVDGFSPVFGVHPDSPSFRLRL